MTPMSPDQTIAQILKRIDALETRLADLERRPRSKPRPKASAPSDAKVAHARAIRPAIAKAMNGRAGAYTARDIADLVGLHPDNGTLRTIGLVCRGWGLRQHKSGGRRPFTFDGRELE